MSQKISVLKEERTTLDAQLNKLRADKFIFEEFWWFYDARPNPFDEGEPDWKLYQDHKSVFIEYRFFLWNKAEGEEKKEFSRIMVMPAHQIDFSIMMQVNIYDPKKQRPVKRGK